MNTPIRRYSGRSLEEAVQVAADDLGPTMEVLDARRVRRGGLYGFFAREEYEVTAQPRPQVGSTADPEAERRPAHGSTADPEAERRPAHGSTADLEAERRPAHGSTADLEAERRPAHDSIDIRPATRSFEDHLQSLVAEVDRREAVAVTQPKESLLSARVVDVPDVPYLGFESPRYFSEEDLVPLPSDDQSVESPAIDGELVGPSPSSSHDPMAGPGVADNPLPVAVQAVDSERLEPQTLLGLLSRPAEEALSPEAALGTLAAIADPSVVAPAPGAEGASEEVPAAVATHVVGPLVDLAPSAASQPVAEPSAASESSAGPVHAEADSSAAPGSTAAAVGQPAADDGAHQPVAGPPLVVSPQTEAAAAPLSDPAVTSPSPSAVEADSPTPESSAPSERADVEPSRASAPDESQTTVHGWSVEGLRSLGVPEVVLSALDADTAASDQMWTVALADAIGRTVPLNGPSRTGLGVAAESVRAAPQLLQAALDGHAIAGMLVEGELVPASPMELSIAIRACVRRW